MNRLRLLALVVLAATTLGISGCGLDQEYLVAVQVVPSSGTAIAGSAGNTVAFRAIAWYAPMDCSSSYSCNPTKANKSQQLTNGTWSTSDSAKTSINANGLATCLLPTSVPVTITATGQGGYYGPIKGTGTLVCN